MNKPRVILGSIMMALGITLTASGAYVFVTGLDSYAIGVMGQTPLTDGMEAQITQMVARSPQEFEARLALGFKQDAQAAKPIEVRRLALQCPDGEKLATIYNTPAGIYGVPSHNLVCSSGFRLLTYDPSWQPRKEVAPQDKEIMVPDEAYDKAPEPLP